jgi:monofunctional biosynthetic peptidoglycan transglycosylase
MKKLLLIGCAVLTIYLAYVAVSLSLLPPVAALKDRKATVAIQVKDWHGQYHPFQLGPKNRYWTPSAAIPAEMKWSVILAEDANFYKHEGVDVKAIKKAIKYDLEKKGLARGASTITQQTAKNIYLSREKTVTRKLKELYLALRMEQELTKGRIIELYLNVVELGPMVYGVGHASHYYFGKPASMMTPRECAVLAAMLPGPRVAYNPYRNMAKVLRRSDMILKLLKGKMVLSEDEYTAAVATVPNINGLQRKVEESIKKDAPFANQSSAVLPPVQDTPPEKEGSGMPPAEQGQEPAAAAKEGTEAGKPHGGAEQ